DANLWFWLTNGTDPATPCATLAASADVIAVLAPPGLLGFIVYDVAPKPVSAYVPGVPVITGPTEGEPAVLCNVTFLTSRGVGVPPATIALPYVIAPLIEGVCVDVGVGEAPTIKPLPDTSIVYGPLGPGGVPPVE